jgi:hypothetical protein
VNIQTRLNVELSRYRFSIGNVDSELVSYCAQVIASSRTHAIYKLQAIIESHNAEAQISTNQHSDQFLCVFFNIDDIGETDIDAEDPVYCEVLICNKRAATIENDQLRCSEHSLQRSQA